MYFKKIFNWFKFLHDNANTNSTIEERISIVTESELLVVCGTADSKGTARNILE
jgi:hypothetical protein